LIAEPFGGNFNGAFEIMLKLLPIPNPGVDRFDKLSFPIKEEPIGRGTFIAFYTLIV
tara:strand:+ start:20 stop:190 length:171 start_codon:yes stop_codon:yes gene_type:complete